MNILGVVCPMLGSGKIKLKEIKLPESTETHTKTNKLKFSLNWQKGESCWCITLRSRLFTKYNLIRWIRGFQPTTVQITFQIIHEACPTTPSYLCESSSGHLRRAFTVRVTSMQLDWCIIPGTTEFYPLGGTETFALHFKTFIKNEVTFCKYASGTLALVVE